MDVVTASWFRWPEARPVRDDAAGWWVELRGPGVPALPRGVWPDPDGLPVEGLEEDSPAERLPATLHEVVEHFHQAASYSGGEAAEHLAQHARLFGAPDLCRHGRGMMHADRPRRDRSGSCRYGGPPGSTAAGLSVDAAQRMATTMAAVQTLHDTVRRRQPVSPRLVEHLLSWPLLSPALAGIVGAEVRRDGNLSAERARQLVGAVLDAAMAATWLRATVMWLPHHRPELALQAGTAAALYIADAVTHVSGLDSDRTYVCSACRAPFTPARAPKPGDGRYCRRPECQSERQRRNQARYRARERGE